MKKKETMENPFVYLFVYIQKVDHLQMKKIYTFGKLLPFLFI